MYFLEAQEAIISKGMKQVLDLKNEMLFQHLPQL